MLVALIGGGQGLQDMMQKNFEGFATNSGFLAAQKTGEAYKGFRKGRWWDLEAIDIERLRSQVKDVEVITLPLPVGDPTLFMETRNTIVV